MEYTWVYSTQRTYRVDMAVAEVVQSHPAHHITNDNGTTRHVGENDVHHALRPRPRRCLAVRCRWFFDTIATPHQRLLLTINGVKDLATNSMHAMK